MRQRCPCGRMRKKAHERKITEGNPYSEKCIPREKMRNGEEKETMPSKG